MNEPHYRLVFYGMGFNNAPHDKNENSVPSERDENHLRENKKARASALA